MDEKIFEGTLILEKLNELGKLDDFYAAVDADDLDEVEEILRSARIDSRSIAIILEKIETGDD